MIGYRLAAQTRCFMEPIKKALHTAARLQCDGVQIDAREEVRPSGLSQTGLRQLRKMLDDLNLRVGSVAFPTRRGYANPQDLQRRIEATLAAMRMASDLDSRTLLCNLGTLPNEDATGERSVLADALQTLATEGNRLGVQLVAQSPATSAQDLIDFIVTLPEGTLSVDLHPAQLIVHDQSPSEFLSVAGRYVAHVHATDGVYDLASGKGIEVQLGRGSAEFPELLGGLEEFGYRGWLTIERRSSSQPVEEIGTAVQFLRSL